jgi:hypothetical protein
VKNVEMNLNELGKINIIKLIRINSYHIREEEKRKIWESSFEYTYQKCMNFKTYISLEKSVKISRAIKKS